MFLSRLLLNDKTEASSSIRSTHSHLTNNFSGNNDSNNIGTYNVDSSSSISRYTDWLIKIPSAWMAGVSSWLIVYPFDVIRSRLQLDNGIPVPIENHSSSSSSNPTTNPNTHQNNTTNQQQTKTVLKYRYKGAYDCIVQ